MGESVSAATSDDTASSNDEGDFLGVIGLEPRTEDGELVYEIEVAPRLMHPAEMA